MGTFMRGLRHEKDDRIKMFKPKMLKEAISLAKMQDYQLRKYVSKVYVLIVMTSLF